MFTWPVDAHPTQSKLARIFAESADSSDAGSLAENLSRGVLGGCLIESRYPEARGRRLEIEIDLPWEGWTTFDSEIVNMSRES